MVSIEINTEYVLYGIGISLFFVVAYFVVGWFISKRKQINKQRLKTKKLNIISEKKVLLYEEKRVIDERAKELKDIDKNKFYFEAKPFSYFKKTKWWQFSYRRWKEKRLMRRFPDKAVLVRIEMNNGTHREFLVKDDASGFTFRGARYVFDLENRYWVTDSLIWAYDFHESLSISLKNVLKPNDALVDYITKLEIDSRKGIKRIIPINDIKETIEQSGITQVENSINPIVLERVIKSEIIQAILQGSALGRLFRVLLILIIIVLIIVALDTVIDFISSDLPQELGLGGGDE